MTGATGPAGAAGAQGNQGVTGATGPTGPAGAQGAQGNQGVTGSTGPTGPAGAQGTQGNAGVTGATGPAGAQGAVGATGPQGPSVTGYLATTGGVMTGGGVRVAGGTFGWSGSVTGLVLLHVGTPGGFNSWRAADRLQDLATGVTGFRLNMTGAAVGDAGIVAIDQGPTGSRKMVGMSAGSGWSLRMLGDSMNPAASFAGGGGALISYEYTRKGATGVCFVGVNGDSAPSF